MTFNWPYIDSWDVKCQRVRLYSLKDDPTEWSNLAFESEYKPKLDELMKRLTMLLKTEFKSK